MFGLETINIWQWWLENGGALYRSGQAPSMMAFELHRGKEEWDRARRLSPLERALHSLQLPPVREWDGVDEHASGPIGLIAWVSDPAGASGSDQQGVHTRPNGVLMTIHVSEAPV